MSQWSYRPAYAVVYKRFVTKREMMMMMMMTVEEGDQRFWVSEAPAAQVRPAHALPIALSGTAIPTPHAM